MIRPFDIRDVNVIQRLRPQSRTLAYELTAVDGVNLLRDAVTSYVTGGRDNNVVLIHRNAHESAATNGNPTAPNIDAFGLMQIVHDPNQTDGYKRAALVLMAPTPDSDETLECWMHLAQEFATHAATHGVHHIVAEPTEYGGEAEALQAAGFAPLIHQDVLKLAQLDALPDPASAKLDGLRETTKVDEALIRMLHMRSAPKLTFQAELTSDLLRATTPATQSWVLTDGNGAGGGGGGEVIGHVAVQEGRRGTGLHMLFRPKAEELALPILHHALAYVRKRKRAPVYCTVRAYQSWLLPVLDELGFVHITSTVLMVRHTAMRVQQPVWKEVPEAAAIVARAAWKNRMSALNKKNHARTENHG
jgi:hypothetical protein